jgi:S-adenosylmethionine:tRNA ribosyltransferase-isomerase
MRTADFDYDLPEELIAQNPSARRDDSRLLVMDRETARVEHRHFQSFPEYLNPGDVLVMNDTRVIPARLRAKNARTAGRFELLLVEEAGLNDWWVMVRPGRRAPPGTRLSLLDGDGGLTGIEGTVKEVSPEGHRRIQFSGTENIVRAADRIGEVPLPPYIRRSTRAGMEADRERYQTVYAAREGSVAAPTAGLHFTEETLRRVRARGAAVGFVTLHVGLGTFAPVKADDLTQHTMHEESYALEPDTVAAIEKAKSVGGRVIAVGTTTLRVLESVAAASQGKLSPARGRTRIFVYPPYRFQVVDALLTNFHLPCSTLLMLVSAFASPGRLDGRPRVLEAYAEAIAQRYRFFSYGDAMFIKG